MTDEWNRHLLPEEVVQAAPGPLGGVVRRGALISGAAFAVVQIVSLIGTLALARLLSPAEVGIFAAGTVLSVVLITLAEGGFRIALIQRVQNVEDAANTVFWVTAAGGLVISLATIAAAPVLGYIFRSDLVAAVAIASSGLLLLELLTTVPDGLMQRRFNFVRMVIEAFRAIVYAVVAVAFAASGFGVWSMVFGQYAAVAVWLLGSWSLARWRPDRRPPTLRLWRELARFSHPVVIWDIVLYARETAQTAIIGRSLGPAALGNYRYGTRMGTLPGVAVVQIGSYVLFPAFARLVGDQPRLRDAFLRALRWIWLAAAPTAALVVAVGQQAVVVLLGERWKEAGLLTVGLAGYGLGLALQEVLLAAILAFGRSAVFYWISALGLMVGLGLLIALLPLGLVGVGLAVSLTEILIGVVLLVLAKPIVAYRFRTIIKILAPPAIAAAVALVPVHLFGRVTGPISEQSTAIAVALLVAQSVVFVLCYVVALTILDYRLVASLIAKARARL